jgi:redox-sensing transcriptional repressor
LIGIYDNDPAKVGRQWNGLVVRHVRELEADLSREQAEIAAVVTPSEAAQAVADRLVACGITAILNFAPVQLQVPDAVTVKTVNLVLELEALSYVLANR